MRILPAVVGAITVRIWIRGREYRFWSGCLWRSMCILHVAKIENIWYGRKKNILLIYIEHCSIYIVSSRSLAVMDKIEYQTASEQKKFSHMEQYSYDCQLPTQQMWFQGTICIAQSGYIDHIVMPRAIFSLHIYRYDFSSKTESRVFQYYFAFIPHIVANGRCMKQ